MPALPALSSTRPRKPIRAGRNLAPIQNGLAMFIPFVEGIDGIGLKGADYGDIGPAGVGLSNTSGMVWGSAPAGLYVSSEAAGAHADAAPTAGALPDVHGPITVMLYARWTDNLVAKQVLFQYGDSVDDGQRLQISAGSSGIVGVERHAGDTHTITSGAFTLTSGADAVFIVRGAGGADTEFWVNGYPVGAKRQTISAGASTGVTAVRLGGSRSGGPGLGDDADAQYYAVGVWGRALPDRMLMQLLGSPFWPAIPNATLGGGVRRGLPCPAFPVRRVDLLPIDQSEGGVVIAARAQRISALEAVLQYDLLTVEEQEQIDDAWLDGDGTVEPFTMILPGESEPRRWVFADAQHRVAHRTAADVGTVIRLLDVTEPGSF